MDKFLHKNPIIYLISGKSRSGKDTVAQYINEKELNCINLQFSSYIKEYAKKVSDWDGSEETKPRELLQQLGTELIRKKINEHFFINRICDDIRVYSYFFDVITISDVRLVKEIETVKSEFNRVYSIHINRDFNSLKENEKKHQTEIDLDNYNMFDYVIENDGSLENLYSKIDEILKRNDKNDEK